MNPENSWQWTQTRSVWGKWNTSPSPESKIHSRRSQVLVVGKGYKPVFRFVTVRTREDPALAAKSGKKRQSFRFLHGVDPHEENHATRQKRIGLTSVLKALINVRTLQPFAEDKLRPVMNGLNLDVSFIKAVKVLNIPEDATRTHTSSDTIMSKNDADRHAQWHVISLSSPVDSCFSAWQGGKSRRSFKNFRVAHVTAFIVMDGLH